MTAQGIGIALIALVGATVVSAITWGCVHALRAIWGSM